MAAKYPAIFKAKSAIGTTTTIEGRQLFWVKISDNPSVDESEPEILYTALHHAREPASASQVIMYMYYLLENYTTDSFVKYLVDNVEMYFVPCVNPDGYIYNTTTNPNGGGLFRKNRRDNGDGTFGVDLNRNYGEFWGYDNFGSSNNTNSDTYRDTAAFSEPETQIMKVFCEAHEFKLALNYHTFSNLLIYPYSHVPNLLTPDSSTFKAYAKFLTTENDYRYGTSAETVSYVANGDSDDWMYGEQSTKPKIFAMTPEAGTVADGFWPAQNRIIDICKENISQNLHLAQLVTKYVAVKEIAPTIFSTLSDYLPYNIQRLGFDSTGTYTVSLSPLTANVIATGSSKNYTQLKLLKQVLDSISFTLSASIKEGDKFSFVLNVDNGAYTLHDTITKVYGTPAIAYTTNASSINGWTTSTWGLSTSVFHSPPGSITDSPLGDYPNKTTRVINLSNQVDLTDAVYAELSFWAKWEIEAGYDYVEITASADNGATWTPLCGNYTRAGSINQNPNSPVYEGYQTEWVHELIRLDDYVGKKILLRFKLFADDFKTYDGFYFDDLEIIKIAPLPLGVTAIGSTPTELSVQIDPNPANESAVISYVLTPSSSQASLLVYDALGKIVDQVSINNVGETNTTLNTVALKSGVYYYQLKTQSNASAMKKLVVVR